MRETLGDCSRVRVRSRFVCRILDRHAWTLERLAAEKKDGVTRTCFRVQTVGWILLERALADAAYDYVRNLGEITELGVLALEELDQRVRPRLADHLGAAREH